MTIKWGDPIECNGVRPDWLRDDEPCTVQWAANPFGEEKWSVFDGGEYTAWAFWGSGEVKAFRVRDDHPAYVALARGFHPWSGGERAPDDWDGGAVLQRCGLEASSAGLISWVWPWWRAGAPEDYDIIGYRKRNTEPHLARIEVEGSGVFIKQLSREEVLELWRKESTVALASATTVAERVVLMMRGLGLVRRDESRAERFTRETGHEVTEAVEAALNWKGE